MTQTILDWLTGFWTSQQPATPAAAISTPLPESLPVDNAASNAMAERILRKWEGCRLAPYQDSKGVWTIGIGTTRIGGDPVTEHTPPITEARADELLLNDMSSACRAVDSAVRVPLADHERAALVSFTYNLGGGALRSSTLLRLLNSGDRQGAADQFPQWCHAGPAVVEGLVRRRAFERAVFLGQQAV